jgi:hypothetical protein
MDSFDDRMWNLGKWETYQFFTWTASGRHGGGGIVTGQSAYNVKKSITPSATVIAGRAFYSSNVASAISTGQDIAFYTNNGATLELNVRIGGGGYVAIYRNTTQIAISASPVCPLASTWYYVEFKGLLDNSVGTAEVQVNGVSVVSFSGDTLNGTLTDIDWVNFGTSGSRTDRIDDVYICNGLGTVNNDFLGDITVEALPVNGNGNSSVLVGSDADSTDNYLLVDESPPSTADYVESGTEGDKDTYAVSNIAGTPSVIHGIAVNSYVAKTDTGSKFSRPVLRSGTTDYVAASAALSTSYVARQDLWEQDPDTGPAAWITAGVNAAEIGFEVRDS